MHTMGGCFAKHEKRKHLNLHRVLLMYELRTPYRADVFDCGPYSGSSNTADIA